MRGIFLRTALWSDWTLKNLDSIKCDMYVLFKMSDYLPFHSRLFIASFPEVFLDTYTLLDTTFSPLANFQLYLTTFGRMKNCCKSVTTRLSQKFPNQWLQEMYWSEVWTYLKFWMMLWRRSLLISEHEKFHSSNLFTTVSAYTFQVSRDYRINYLLIRYRWPGPYFLQNKIETVISR